MALILSSGKALTIFGGIGYDLFKGTIIKSCQSIGNTIYYFGQSPDHFKEINEMLHLLDIEAKITIIHSYIKSVQGDAVTPSNSLPEEDMLCEDNLVEKIEHIESITDEDVKGLLGKNQINAQHVALMYLNQSLQRIDHILQNLRIKLQRYQAKWFRNWRTFDSASSIKRLKTENDILDQRLKLLGHLCLIN